MKKGLIVLLCVLLAAVSPIALAENSAVTYQGTAPGNSGDIVVSVTVEDQAVTDIKVDEAHDTYYLFEYVENKIIPEIVEQQSLAVDTVAGATISSRGFLNAVKNALEQSDVDLAAMQQVSEKAERVSAEETVDVVVVGAGAAGLSTALRLQQQQVNVVLLEQLDVVGGTMLLSGGTFLMANDDETAAAYEATITSSLYVGDLPVAEGSPNLDRIHLNIENSKKAYQMFQEMGANMELYYGTTDIYNGVMPERYADYINAAKAEDPNGYYCMGAWTIEQIKNAYLSHGGKLLTGTKATKLLTDESGKVIGVQAQSDDTDYTFTAQQVVLATGSYTHNADLIAQYMPSRVGDYACTTIGADGSGIEMALDVGAVMSKDNYVNGFEMVAYLADAYKTAHGTYVWSDLNQNYAMIVGRDGERVVSESNGDFARYYTYDDGIDYLYGVYSEAMLKDMGALDAFHAEVEKCNGQAPYYSAATLDELAEKCGFQADSFAASTAAFNEYCTTGVDPLGAGNTAAHIGGGDVVTAGSQDASTKLDLAEGPYYAVRITLVSFDFIGGIETNNDGQVLTADQTVIDGLYAVGFTSSREFQGSGAASHYCNGLAVSTGVTAADAIVSHLDK